MENINNKNLVITKEQFEAYESVRTSGVTNMFAVTTVQELSGLDKATIFEIMKNYSDLKKQFGEEEETERSEKDEMFAHKKRDE